MNDDKIRISPDALIAMIVTEAQDRELAQMPSLEEMNEDFQPSEKFQRKWKPLFMTQSARQIGSSVFWISSIYSSHLLLLFPSFHVLCSPSRLCGKLLSQRLLSGTISLYRLYMLMKNLLSPHSILRHHIFPKDFLKLNHLMNSTVSTTASSRIPAMTGFIFWCSPLNPRKRCLWIVNFQHTTP